MPQKTNFLSVNYIIHRFKIETDLGGKEDERQIA